MSSSSLDFYTQVLFPSLVAGVRLAGVFDSHLREAWKARRDWEESFQGEESGTGRGPRIHLHVASAGELEQGIGVRRAVDRLVPDAAWSLSFSSPSGRRHLDGIGEEFTMVSFLPLDRRADIRRFLDRIHPDLILFIRYDVWPVLVDEARTRGIPMILACGTIGEARLQTPLVRTLTRGTYASLDRISAVSPAEAERLRRAAPGVPVQVDGDARVDRLLQRAESVSDPDLELVRRWIGVRQVMLAGSTWSEDEELWSEVALPEETVFVIAPHMVGVGHIGDLLNRFEGSITLESLRSGEVTGEEKVLVIDRLGLLADLYRFADIAWVGGGFGRGVHSVAEPAVAGIPVMSGPNIHRSPDARSLRDDGGLLVIADVAELQANWTHLLHDSDIRQRAVQGVTTWVDRHRGGAGRIAGEVVRLLRRKNLSQ